MKKKYLFLLGVIFVFGVISFVSGANECCVQFIDTDGGESSCQNVVAGTASCGGELGPPSLGVDCENLGFCGSGICLDRSSGFCSENAPKGTCENDGGEWFDRALSDVNECRPGCCVLGVQTDYVTQIQCGVLSEEKGIEEDWDSNSLSQLDCADYQTRLARGACVDPGKGCRITTGAVCQDRGDDFFEDLLCTNPTLGTNCNPTDDSICSPIGGDYNVYFLDDCENPSNIYDNLKKFDGSFDGDDEYWERISSADCFSDADSTSCGICNYPTESRCLETNSGGGVGGSDYICKNLDCGIVDGKNRLNTEEWCVYQSRVGDGKDIIGSEHWLKYCKDGEVKINDDQDSGRMDICAEKTQTTSEGDPFTEAQYRTNLWFGCIFPIENNVDEAQCNEKPDCRVHQVNIHQWFNFKVCVPKYPIGFDLSLGRDATTPSKICGLATQTCVAVETKKKFRDWKWYGGTDACLGKSFVEQMNEFCYSLGDCGGYINIQGDYERYYDVVGSGDQDLSSKYLGNKNPSSNDDFPSYINQPGSAGTYADYGSIVGNIPGIETDLSHIVENDYDGAFEGGLKSDIIASLKFSFDLGIAQGLDLLGFGKEVRYHNIEFRCQPWVPPPGGDNCDLCGSDGLPCTEYQCNSLGAVCDTINEGLGDLDLICVDKGSGDEDPSDINLVSLKKNNEDITSSVTNLGPLGFSVEACMDDYTEIEILLETKIKDLDIDEYGLCRYAYQPISYSNITAVGGNLNQISTYEKGDVGYSFDHLFDETLSLSHQGVYGRTQGLEEDKGKLSLYVRCMDPNGNSRFEEYKIDFLCLSSKDETPPGIMEFNPPSESSLRFGWTNITTIITINEPAGCRFSQKSGVSFDDMTQVTEGCYLPDPEDITPDMFPVRGICGTEITNLTEDENNLYFKCKDRNGNIGQDWNYKLYASESPLRITSIIPEDDKEIRGKDLYFALDLRVTTSGGSDDGDAQCKYEFVDRPQYASNDFSKTGGRVHEQIFTVLPSGNYDMKVSCEDSAKNLAENITSFKLKLDFSAPNIIRAFKEGNRLKLISDEKALCVYSNDKIRGCNFNVNTATEISSIHVFEHSVEWDSGKTYFIKCKDQLLNANKGCAITVNPS